MQRRILLVILTLVITAGGCQNLKTQGEIMIAKPPILPDFVVQPGDTIKIAVWQKPELSQQVTVQLNGKIRLMLIGELEIKDKSLAQVQKEISDRLQKYIQQPLVEVSLIAPNFGIYIFGAIGRPGIIMAKDNLTILKAIILSGGFGQFADKSKVVLIRRSPGKETRYIFDIETYLSGEDLAQDLYLQPGDIIYIPKLPF